MNQLAMHGGPKTIGRQFARYNSIGKEELEAASEVLRTGVLSAFVGSAGPDFLGGPKVQAFERAWERSFAVPHAVSVNSLTSGLIAAVGAVGVEPGDEVIVSPWTMAASATSILVWNGIPVFADIEPETFNLDPAAVKRAITPRTRAIMVSDIFGHAARLDEIMAIAAEHKLMVIEDAAQAPYARYTGGRFVGTVAHIGGFSLNYHKHVHTGEGGICVTSSPELAKRMQLIRNHAEAVVAGLDSPRLDNMIGFNFRLGEIEAAIGVEQLKKLPTQAPQRTRVADLLTRGLTGLKGLRMPVVAPGCSHVYYVYPLVIDVEALGVDRGTLIRALEAEGVPDLMAGYVNVHMLPMYQQKQAYGRKGFPWVPAVYAGNVSYARGICPVAERLHERDFLGIEICQHVYDDADIDLVVAAFRKVWANLDSLRAR